MKKLLVTATVAAITLSLVSMAADIRGQGVEHAVRIALQQAGRREVVPSDVALSAARKLVEEVFGSDFAKATDSGEKLRLASLLSAQARELGGEAALRFAAYERAVSLAAEACDLPRTLAVVDEWCRVFDLNTLDRKASAIELVNEHAKTPETFRELVDVAVPLGAEAAEADQYALARRFSKVAEAAASRTSTESLLAEVRKRTAELSHREESFKRMSVIRERLKENADDPMANFEVGKYYALVKRHWAKGLPYLMKAGDQSLRKLASMDAANPTSAVEVVALADGWWERSQKESDPYQLSMQLRAAQWYEKAIPLTAGLTRTKSVKRIELARERALGNDTGLAPAALGPVGLVEKFDGHTDEVKSVAFSSDGRLVASAGLDQTIRVWDLAAKKEFKTLRGHSKQIWQIAFVPGRRQLLSASWDATARLWDVQAGAELRRYSHRIDINGLVVTRDGTRFFTGSDDHFVYQWNLENAEEIRKYAGHSNFVYALAISPDGGKLATGGVDRTVRVLEIDTGKVIAIFEGHTNSVTQVLFSQDGRHVLSAGDNAVHVWDLATGKETRRIEGARGNSLAIGLTPDGRRLLVGGDDRVIRILDLASGKELAKLEGHTDTIISLAISPDGRRAASAGLDRSVRIWNISGR